MEILFVIAFVLLIAWSNSLQITLQAVKDSNLRIRIIGLILLSLSLAGVIAVYG